MQRKISYRSAWFYTSIPCQIRNWCYCSPPAIYPDHSIYFCSAWGSIHLIFLCINISSFIWDSLRFLMTEDLINRKQQEAYKSIVPFVSYFFWEKLWWKLKEKKVWLLGLVIVFVAMDMSGFRIRDLIFLGFWTKLNRFLWNSVFCLTCVHRIVFRV